MFSAVSDLIKKIVEERGASAWGFMLVALVVMLFTFLRLSPELFKKTFSILWFLSPIWVPIFLIYVFWIVWNIYVKAKFINSQEYVLLEIKLPREILKSPLAMETVLSGLHHTMGESTEIDRNWHGKMRTWFSLEIASIEGNVRFFIWTRDFYRTAIEALIYAQYPEVEITEADDYTRSVRFDLKEISIWGCDFKLKKPDAYPIKTYVDYGLDKDPKEELKVDPIAPTIELMGSIGKGEQFWLQFLVRATRKERKEKKTWFGKVGWEDEARDLVNDLMLRDPKTKSARELSPSGFPIIPSLSKGEQDVIEAIERSITKVGFDVGIRGIYLAKQENFNPGNIAGLIGILKQYNTASLNEFTPTRYMYGFSYPWEDYKEIRQNHERKKVFDAYRRRSYFFHPYKTQEFVLNSEELATVYHFPGSTVSTPTVGRVSSKKSEAPSDLPI